MNDAACLKNITACLLPYGLKLCDEDKDICLKHGYCITSIFNPSFSYCLCYTCYTGKYCEEEKLSRNIWYWGLATQQTESLINAERIILLVVSIISILNCLLCLQTYLTSFKIRQTNIGVYLILGAFCSLLFSLLTFITTVLSWFPSVLLTKYPKINCFITSKHFGPSLAYIWIWLVAFVAIERMLTSCFYYSLFDSRRRSIITSILLIIICPLTTLPGVFTVKDIPDDEIQKAAMSSVACINYTPTGYIINKVIVSIHTYVTLALYIFLIVAVFIRLLLHRRRLFHGSRTSKNIYLILSKHRDLFVPLTVQTICTLPLAILSEMMTCEKAANSANQPSIYFAFALIAILPEILSFFMYVVVCNVYMTEFWETSLVGRCLVKVKKLICSKKCLRTSTLRSQHVLSIDTTSTEATPTIPTVNETTLPIRMDVPVALPLDENETELNIIPTSNKHRDNNQI